MTTSPDHLFGAIDATWPAAQTELVGPCLLRRGEGGGKRVSAATLNGPFDEADIDLAERGMTEMGQTPLFMVRSGEQVLDDALAARGYKIVDPVGVLVSPVTQLTDIPLPAVTAFSIWEPLAIMTDIWAAGGVGPGRIAVMSRASHKTAILLRWQQRPAGVGFIAIDGNVAMVHAVEVLEQHRRQGVAGLIMRAAAFWAKEQGAETLSVLCTHANEPASKLYSSLGFVSAAQYHYRQHPEIGDTEHG